MPNGITRDEKVFRLAQIAVTLYGSRFSALIESKEDAAALAFELVETCEAIVARTGPLVPHHARECPECGGRGWVEE